MKNIKNIEKKPQPYFLALNKKKFKVLAVDKESKKLQDKRTLAVNANSKDFLVQLGIWNKLKSKPQKTSKTR